MADDTCHEIMCATYRALCDRGYADLTMQDIADESEKSKAALHYHYDTKADLLASFLDHLYEDFEERMEEIGGPTPADRLYSVVDAAIGDDGDGAEDFRTAFLEIQAQAPYDHAFRERLAEFDRIVYVEIRHAVRAGIEVGQFSADVDPDRVASFVVTTINGAHCRNVAVGHDVAKTRAAIHDYLRTHVVEDATGDAHETTGNADETDSTADPTEVRSE